MSTVGDMRELFAQPETLVRRVYAYVAYRIGDNHDAEDVTSSAIERAVRYRASYDPRKGDPVSWVIGIARTCVNDHLRNSVSTTQLDDELAEGGNLETEVARRLTVASAVARLDARDRDLVALRYGADLGTREIGRLLDMRSGAVDVALHRVRERLRPELDHLVETRRSHGAVVVRPAPGTTT